MVTATDDRTTLCRHCAQLIRWWPCPVEDVHAEGDRCMLNVWRHAVIGSDRDHAPEPMPEGEARAIYGDR